MELKEHTTADQAACRVRWGRVEFTMVSAYMPPKPAKIEDSLVAVETVVLRCPGSALVCADTNAWNTVWGSSRTDSRGAKVGELVAGCQLVVANEPSGPTFVGARGSSWIDVTLATAEMSRRIVDWRLGPGTSSDHRTIAFRLAGGEGTRHADGRFVTRSARWEEFVGALEASLVDRDWDGLAEEAGRLEVDKRVDAVTNVILAAAGASLARSRARARPATWWTPELTRLKRAFYKARRRAQRCGSDARKVALRREAKERFREYRNAVRRQRRRSWDEFVVCESEKNPWGIPYRVAFGKVGPAQVMADVEVGGRRAASLEEAAGLYLEATYPRDDPSQDSVEDAEIRRAVGCPPGTELCPPWDIWDVRIAVEKQKVGRAPGLDGIDAAILRRSAPYIEEELLDLFNMCLDEGYYPSGWKEADVRLLYKGGGRDKTSPKSYRPICLLPVMSKVLECLMVARLQAVLQRASHDRQYGSTRGRGTADALVRVRREVEEKAGRYVVLIMFDISSAYDSVWWPDVLGRLQELETPSNLYELVRSYLSGRRARVRVGSAGVVRVVERGCPQGSVLGPALWKLVFDRLLGVMEVEGFSPVAYVDDLAVVLEANSRAGVVREAERCAGVVARWCGQHKLKMAAAKTQAALLRGSVDRRHPISLRVEGEIVRLSEEIKYLGVTFRRRLDVSPHIGYLQERVAQSLNGMRRIGGAFWGLRYPATRAVYRGVVLGILRYASPAWSVSLTKGNWRKLATAQRTALLGVTRAYRTVSHEAAQVLAGELPIDLVLRGDGVKFMLKRQGLGGLPVELRRRVEEDPGRWRAHLKDYIVGEWGARWDATTKGATLKKYFPTVRSRLLAEWVRPDYWSSQLLTGHGGFRWKLRMFGKDVDPLCPVCQVPETAEHVVVACAAYEGIRMKMLRGMGMYALTEADLPRLVEKDNYAHFTEFIRGWAELVGPDHFALGRARRQEMPGEVEANSQPPGRNEEE